MRFKPIVERYRFREVGMNYSRTGDDYGAFFIPGPCGIELKVIASSGDSASEVNWEHVSVSTKKRCPNWTEMCFIKDLFWDDEEVVMQLHPAKSKWINVHPYCLHLYRPTNQEIPLPPEITV